MSSCKLGYLGPSGTFSEEAARRSAVALNLTDVQYTAFKSIPDVLLGVAKGQCSLGVVPAENSIEGSVVVTLDYLVHEVDLHICGELVVPVSLSLLTWPEAELSQISTIYSHPQPFGQSRRRLQQLVPQAALRAVSSTAEGARLVKESGDKTAGAIGTRLAGELYGLSEAVCDLQDVDGNATRFLLISQKEVAPSGRDKTSVAFVTQDKAGTLYRALEVFAARGINLTKLESRPAKRSLGDYLFFVDLEGHKADSLVEEALEELDKRCQFVKIMGSYPRVDY